MSAVSLLAPVPGVLSFGVPWSSGAVTRRAASGFTLVEVLMCLTMLALIMLPFTLTMNSAGQSSKAAYLQSTRTILMNSLRAETTPLQPTYAANFTDGSMQTGVTDSGQTIAYRRVVDITNSPNSVPATTAMKRTTHIYLYTNSTDANNAPRYKTSVVSYPKVFRMRFGDTTDVIDEEGRYWFSDAGAQRVYDGTNKVPGWSATNWTSPHPGSDIINTAGRDDYLYQQETGGSPLNFAMDVEGSASTPVPYTVKILFAETNTGDGLSNPRRMNFTIEGVSMNTTGPYDVYQGTGGNFNAAQMVMFDTVVSDGVLNITISSDSGSGDTNVNPHGIEVIRRTGQ